ncbi:MAG: hypothetical protein KF861_19935 [Planctomycetaceae bacterium]|nr:hypothetical protein [Planctomycetaceae bacterium]
MANKKSGKLAPGATVRVLDGVTLPEFPQQSIAGWTGAIAEQKGRGADIQYIIEWDDATVDAMPESYRAHCEQHGLYFKMACLPASQVVAADAPRP